MFFTGLVLDVPTYAFRARANKKIPQSTNFEMFVTIKNKRMDLMNNENLIELAIEARKNAKSPTKYYVGTALLTKSGKVYTGCNLGSENGLFNICAERVAIVKMLSEGEEKIEKIATKIYGATGVEYTEEANKIIEITNFYK